MSGKINLEDWFSTRLKKVECGVELELLLFDSRIKEPLNNNSVTEEILRKLPRQIYKDYYPYQLELRTQPHSDPQEIIDETKNLYRLASKEFLKKGIYIIPVPSIAKEGYVYCGMHMHISYPNDRKLENYYMRAMGMYPFILALADHTKNFETSDLLPSDRIHSSHHIGMPELTPGSFLSPEIPNRKYRDIIFSPSVSNHDNRSRMVKPSTIEVRMLDTPSLFKFYEFMVYYIVNLARGIKTRNPMVSMLRGTNRTESVDKLTLSRRLIANQRYGVNKVFRMLNSDVCETLSNHFNIKFPHETQFEYREKLGLSANVNGYLTMATKGEWL